MILTEDHNADEFAGPSAADGGSSAQHERRRPRVLLGITGSVAAIKGPELAVRLAKQLDVDVRILLTQGGRNFWDKAKEYNELFSDKLEKLLSSATDGGGGAQVEIHYADEEWKDWNRLGDPVLHIDLRDWADMMVVAPLSAHSLAKFATGLCDDTLSCVVRAWDFGQTSRPGKPMVLAPAMNTAMWQHPLTRQQLSTIMQFYSEEKQQSHFVLVDPQVKQLACGEEGDGALASVARILEAVKESLSAVETKIEMEAMSNLPAGTKQTLDLI